MMFFLCQFYYPEDAKSYNVPLNILWGEMYPKQLDNPNNVQGKKKTAHIIRYFHLPLDSLLTKKNRPILTKIFLLSNVVIMYKCEKMPSSCGECLTQHEAFSCGWCKPSNQCSLQSSCTTKDSWLSKNENCPNPRILKVGYMNSNNYLKLVTHNVIQHQNHKVKLHTMLKSVLTKKSQSYVKQNTENSQNL